MALNKRNLLSHSPRGQVYEIKVLGGLGPLGGTEGDSSMSPSFRQLLASLDVSWLLDAPNFSLHPMVLSVCVDRCVSFPLLHLEK